MELLKQVILNIVSTITANIGAFTGQVTGPTPTTSTSFANKAYVDAQVGTADTLSEVLALGNTTGGTNIDVSPNDVIDFFTGSNLNYGRINANSEGLNLNTVANRHMIFSKGSTETMRIDTSGNVGIGTTSPSQKLHVVGNIYSVNSGTDGGQIRLANSGGGSNWYWAARTAGLNLGELGAADGRIFIANGGNVGIGTTSPTAKLHVAGTGLFTGLVSGITPVNAANFVTKAYVDGSGGGTGPFLPLAGGTMTGTNGITMPDDFPLKLGVNGSNDSQIFWDGNNLEIQARAASSDIVFRAANSSAQLLEFLTIDGGVGKN